MSLEEFTIRAEKAEQEIKLLQQRFAALESNYNKTTSPQSKPEGHSDKSTKSNSNKKDETDAKIPFSLIEDEAFNITEEGVDAKMTVTIHNGELFPPFISSKGLTWLQNNYSTNKLDIFIGTYAKAGTTLGIKLVYELLSKAGITPAAASPDDMADPWRAVPWIEVETSQQLYNNKNTDTPSEFINFVNNSNEKNLPRIWKTHCSWYNFPAKIIGKDTKIIHIIRNPKDVLCSYYNFFSKEPLVSYKGDFNTLFNWYCDGTVVHSNFFDFELSWWRASKDDKYKDQILWLSFEDMVRDPIGNISKCAKFLHILLDNTQIEQIAEEIKFETMKEQANKKASDGGGGSILMNKGQTGRWKKFLTKEQSNKIDRIVKSKFSKTDIILDYGDDKDGNPIFYRG